MLNLLNTYLDLIEDAVWNYTSFPLILALGLFLSLKAGFPQFFRFGNIIKIFYGLTGKQKKDEAGIHPIKVFFASVGGCIGIGNIASVLTAVQIGGPGALFWLWTTGFVGMLVKYSEVYLGVKYRVANPDGGYNGGPMYFLKAAFKNNWIPKLACILLCFYGVEVYMFNVIVSSASQNFNITPVYLMPFLIFLVIYAGLGGVRRVSEISSAIIPVFLAVFIGMTGWILFLNAALIPELLKTIFTSAFTGHAAVGGFAGSTLLVTMSQGVRRACYTGDLGIGYASVIHSETSVTRPEKQAALSIFGIFLDTFIVCTASILIVLITGAWQEPTDSSLLMQKALEGYFPYMNFFMPMFLFLLGYSTMIAFFVVGLKCARFLSPTYGAPIYCIYAVCAFIFFSFVDNSAALSAMQISGALLLFLNLTGIFLLRKEINFDWRER